LSIILKNNGSNYSIDKKGWKLDSNLDTRLAHYTLSKEKSK